MTYEVFDPQTNVTKVCHYQQVKVDVNSNSWRQAKDNWDALDALQVGEAADIKGYDIKRIS